MEEGVENPSVFKRELLLKKIFVYIVYLKYIIFYEAHSFRSDFRRTS